MIIPDINLLIYAHDSASPFHSKARIWWEGCLNGNERVGLLTVVVLGFVRIATHPRIFRDPLSAAEAAGQVRRWMARPQVKWLEPGSGHIEDVLSLLESVGVAGNLVTDAQLAAAALQHNAVLHTTDADFTRFAGLRWFNPITGSGSEERRRRSKA